VLFAGAPAARVAQVCRIFSEAGEGHREDLLMHLNELAGSRVGKDEAALP